MIPWNATCVVIDERAVMIEGPSGSGKSALALALIDRGAWLVGDDALMLEPHGDRLVARPHPGTHGLLEIRNLGLVPYPVTEAADVALVVRFAQDAPRFIDTADIVVRAGIALPAVAIWPEPHPPALKVEHALRLYGRPARSALGRLI